MQTASEGGGSSSQAVTDEVDATQPSAPAGPRNLTEDLQTLSPQFAELSSVLRGLRSQTTSGAGPNPVDEMATPSDSFHPAGNGGTPRTSQASHTQSPPSPAGESFETMFTRVMSGCADTLCDFAQKRLDEYIAGPEFGQKLTDLTDQVLTDYLADTTVTENLFLSILYQPKSDQLMDDRFMETIRTYMDTTLPPLVYRLISHRFAQDQTRVGPNPPSPPVGRVTEWLSSLSSPAISAVGPDPPLNDDNDEIMPRRDDTTVRRSHRSQKSKKSKASKSRKASRRDDPPPSSPSSSDQSSQSSVPTKKSRKTQKSRKSRGKSKKDKPKDSSSSDDTTSTSTDDDSKKAGNSESTFSARESDDSSSKDASSSNDSSSSANTTTKKRREKRQLKKERKILQKAVSKALEMEKEDAMTPLRPVNSLFKDAIDYRTYQLDDRTPECDEKATRRLRRKRRDVKVDMQGVLFTGKDPVAVINFLNTLKEACNSNNVHEGAAKRLFQYFLKGNPRKTLRKSLKSRSKSKQGRKRDREAHKVTTYPGIVQMLLKTYASDDILSEAHASVCDYKKPDSITPITYAERLSDKAERTGDVFPEDTLKEVFLTGLPHNYRGYVRGHLSSNPTLSLAELARFAANVSDMQKATTATSSATTRNSGASTSPNNDSKKSGKRGQQGPASSHKSSPGTTTKGSTAPLSVSTIASIDEVLAADMAAAPPGQVGQYHSCRVCLGHDHATPACKYLEAAMTDEFLQVREANYQRIAKLRRQTGSRQYHRYGQGSSSQAAGSSSTAPAPN